MALTDEKLAMIDILLTKPEIKQVELAELFSVHPTTVRAWQDDPDVKAEIARRGAELVDTQLFAKARSGSIEAAKLYYQRFGYLGKENEDPFEYLFRVTPEEIESLKADLAKEWLENRKKKRKYGKKHQDPATAPAD